MKLPRFVLVTGAALGVILMLLAGVASSSWAQTWMARRFLAGDPSRHASIGSLSVGLHGARATDLSFERNGVRLTLPSIDIEAPLWPAIWSRQLRVSRLSAKGWTLDLSRAPEGPGRRFFEAQLPANPEFPVLGWIASLPREFPNTIAGFKLLGIPAGGRLELRGEAVAPSPAGIRPADGARLAVSLTAVPTASGESYAVELADGGRPFAGLQMEFFEASRRFSGVWRLDPAAGDGARIATQGKGSFAADAAGLEVAGRLDGGAGRLAKFLPDSTSAGTMKISAEFDLAERGGGTWSVKRLTATLTGAQPILTVTALQGFEFSPETGPIKMEDPARDLAKISLRQVPLRWVRSWFGAVLPIGGSLRGELMASPRGRGFALRSSSPLSLGDFSAPWAGRPRPRALTASFDVAVDVRPEGWQVALDSANVRAGSDPLLVFGAKIGRLTGADQRVKVAGNFRASLPAILDQCAIGRRGDLKRGDVVGDFSGTLGAQRAIGVNFLLSGMESDSGGKAWPAISGRVRADFGPAGQLTFYAPLRFDRENRASDLTLSGTWGAALSGLEAEATGNQLFVDDLQGVAGIFADAGSIPGRPFWSGIDGRLAFALKEVVSSGHFAARNLNGVLRIGSDTLELSGLRASLDGAEFSLNGKLGFAPMAAEPYAFQADLSLGNFDATPVFREGRSDGRPTFEGRFDLAGRFAGSSRDLRDIVARARGDWKITSKGGIFRALSQDIESKAPASNKIAVIGAFIGDVADTVTFRKEGTSQDKKSRAIDEFSRIMTSIRYDRIDVVLSRGASPTIGIREFSLISPEIRLQGGGQLGALPGVPLLRQPLAAELKLSVRGHTADLLRTAGLLAAAKDNLGYTACTLPMKMDGTLLQPDLGDFRRSLLKIAP